MLDFLDELVETGTTVLTPAEASLFCGIDAQVIRIRAVEHPERLGFVTYLSGKGTKDPTKSNDRRPWVRIPAPAFLSYLEQENESAA